MVVNRAIKKDNKAAQRAGREVRVATAKAQVLNLINSKQVVKPTNNKKARVVREHVAETKVKDKVETDDCGANFKMCSKNKSTFL